jgi:ankyrin repeat protein
VVLWNNLKMIIKRLFKKALIIYKLVINYILDNSIFIQEIYNIKKAIKNNDYDLALKLTIAYGQDYYLNEILKHPDFDINKKKTKNSFLYCAVLYGHFDIAKQLMNNGAIVDFKVEDIIDRQKIFHFYKEIPYELNQELKIYQKLNE